MPTEKKPMLHLILGRAGSGKTEYLRSLLQASCGQETVLLLVPEQSSFQNERAMLRRLGAKEAKRVQVFSFSRLAEYAFLQYGGAAGRRLDDGGRSVLMSLALEQVKDQLEFYRKSAEHTELIGLLLNVSAEFKMCEIRPQDLQETALRANASSMPSALRQKMQELSLILSAYDALVAQSYIDPQDDLTRFTALLQEHSMFQDAVIGIDEFQSFTVQEYQVIRAMLAQGADVHVALCADALEDPEQGVGLFSLVRRTAKNLMRMAKEEGHPVAVPVILEPGKRFEAPGIAALEEGIYRTARPGRKPSDGVTIYEAKDLYDEAEYTAATIRHLVMQENYRYRDFAVIMRTPESYYGILDAALEHRDIPCFMDEPQKTDSEPIMRLVLSAFQAVKSGFASDDLFVCLKTGLFSLTAEEIAELENYTFLWNISGKKWRESWDQHPQGFAERWSEQDTALLEHLNELRLRVIEPLETFAKRLIDTDGEGMAEAVYRLLEQVNTAEALRTEAKKLEDSGRPDLAERQLRLWDMLMEVLDQAALVLRGENINAVRFAELLRLIIQTKEIASIPQGLDEVTVGAANRIRTEAPKVVFLLGAVQGEFPLAPGSLCVFNDTERRELIALGLPLNDTVEGMAVQERFLAYSAMCAPSQRLYISWASGGAGGESRLPSSIVTEARAVLQDVQTDMARLLPPAYFANAQKPAFELAAQLWGQDTELSAALKSIFAKEEQHRPKILALERAAQKKPFAFADSNFAKALFGNDMHLSATQIESFYLCHFQYFCRYGMRAKERRPAELDALEYGSLMHYLLEHLFREMGAQVLNEMEPPALRAEIVRLLEEYLEKKLGGKHNKTARFAYLFSRLADAALVIVQHTARELCQSEFVPKFFEYPIGGEGNPQMILPLPDGSTVSLNGKIDRVDIMKKGDTEYLRVVDYKTGKKEFKLSDVLYGVNVQMLLYLACLSSGSVKPSGVLYVPASPPAVAIARGTSAEKRQQEEDKKLRMNGLIVEDEAIIRGMEPAGQGKYIPVTLKDGVPAKKDSVVSPGELQKVLDHVTELVSGMAQELHKGKIAAIPLSGEYNACAWCPYGPVCGHEENDPAREMRKWDRDAVLKELFQNKPLEKEDAPNG